MHQLARGERLGEYLITSESPMQGGMGTVYFGVNLNTGAEHALKLMREDQLSKVMKGEERFRTEIETLKKLESNVHVVKLIDVKEDQGSGLLYFIMERLHGADLERRLNREERFSVIDCVDFLKQAAQGLIPAHDKGIVHRDIKLNNVFLEDHPRRIKLIDFGIALLTDAARRTRASDPIYTLGYASPEQLRDPHNVDHRTDIYSLGITFYWLLRNMTPTMVRKPPDLEHPTFIQLPRLRRIIAKMIAEDVSARYQSLHELLRDFAEEGVLSSGTNDATGILSDDWLELHKQLRSRVLTDSALTDSQKGMIDKILEDEHNELSQISEGKHYEVDLGLQHAFLVRASSLFREAAKGVYANSLDKVSSFWLPARARELSSVADPPIEPDELVKGYIASQPEGTIRLFAFSDPNNVWRYSKVLDLHVTKYGQDPKNDGRVLLTSYDAYMALMEKLFPDSDPNLPICGQEDFAILKYPTGESKLARLDHRKLRFAQQSIEPHTPLGRYVKLLSEMAKKARPGVISTHQGQTYGAWQEGLATRDIQFHGFMNSLFPKAKSLLCHTVCVPREPHQLFRDDLPILRRKLFETRKHLLEHLDHFRTQYGLVDIQVIEKDGGDGEVSVRREIYGHNTLGLAMLFSPSPKLDVKGYYSDAYHQELRIDFYTTLFQLFGRQWDLNYKQLMDELRAAVDSESLSYSHHKALLFTLEEVLERFMVRRDYVVLHSWAQ